MIVAIMLAAGSSKRFGRDKLTINYRGRPLCRHALDALTSSTAVDETIVVVNPNFVIPRDVEKGRCRFVVNPDHEEGMGSSLRVGVGAASSLAQAYVIALADMPLVRTDIIDALIDFHIRSGKKITVPVYKGLKGHPVVMSGSLRDELLKISGDVGARIIMQRHAEDVAEFETQDEAVIKDIDTVEDVAHSEAESGGESRSTKFEI